MNKSKVLHIINRVILYTVFILLALIVLIPVAWAIMNSFKTKSEFGINDAWKLPKQLYFTNYKNAWMGANMGAYFINTIFITLLSLAFLLILSIPCAYVLTRLNSKTIKVLRVVMLAGLFINVNYIVVPLFNMINGWGRSIEFYGLASNPITVSLLYASTSIAFSVYILTGFFKGLPKAFEEAASIDGCKYWRMLFSIVVPLAMPSIMIIILFNFLKFWNEYLIAVTFLTDPKTWTLSIGLLDLMNVERLAGDNGRMFAGLTIVMVPVILVFIIFQNQLTKGVTVGGVKG